MDNQQVNIFVHAILLAALSISLILYTCEKLSEGTQRPLVTPIMR